MRRRRGQPGSGRVGLGGVWLGEHRDAATAERVRQLQRSALAALPTDEAVLRARLTVRIAAESAYRQGTDALVERLDDVRTTGDPTALVEALSLVHHALLQPGGSAPGWRWPTSSSWSPRPRATSCHVLVAVAWRTLDLFLAGDPPRPGRWPS